MSKPPPPAISIETNTPPGLPGPPPPGLPSSTKASNERHTVLKHVGSSRGFHKMSLAPPVPKTPKAFIRSRARTKGGTIRPRSSMEEQLDASMRDMLLWVRLPPKTVGKYKKATAHTGNWAPCYQTSERDEKNRTLYKFLEAYQHMDLKDPSFLAPPGNFAINNPEKDLGPLIENIQSLNKTVSNMVQLTQVHEATILHNLQMRYSHDEFMTSVGPILVVINPFQYIAHKYGMDIVHKYNTTAEELDTLPPHVYGIGQQAFASLSSERMTQAILISGESGAGKTETTKKVLQYLAEVAGSKSGIEERLLSANPILEAFGNAKTLRNNNSSRFGKFLQIFFHPSSLHINGCLTESYLLEKTRVTNVGDGERSYHIFYQLLAGTNATMRKKLRLSNGQGPIDFNYLKNGDCNQSDAAGMADGEQFQFTADAMQHLRFQSNERLSAFKLISGILHLGNVSFKAGKEARHQNEYADVDRDDKVAMQALDDAAFLLGIEPSALAETLCMQTLSVAGDITEKLLTPEEAAESRDALAKFLYSKLFDWLVAKLNIVMNEKSSEAKDGDDDDDDDDEENEEKKNETNGNNDEIALASNGNNVNNANDKPLIIGVLDIFGFEIFEHNTFEQLCINFTNEKLQQVFNRAVFKDEAEACKEQGIEPPNSLGFADNQDVLDLMEKKPMGLMLMLDEEVRVVRGSDESYLRKMFKAHLKKSKRLLDKKKGYKTKRSEFWIVHFAGDVKYDVTGFLDKNRDTLSSNLKSIVENSKASFISQTILKKAEEAPGNNAVAKAALNGARRRRGGRKRVQPTQFSQFQKQLRQLMKALKTAKHHFIRCIKPNEAKKPRIFDSINVNRQLFSGGVHSAVSVRQQGYPHRIDVGVCAARYGVLVKGMANKVHPNATVDESKALTIEIFNELEFKYPPLKKEMAVGKSMVFMREPLFDWLERYRDVMKDRSVRKIQKCVRGYNDRQFVQSMIQSRNLLRSAIASKNLGRAQEILQVVNRRSGKRVAFVKEEREIARLVDQARTRENLIELLKLEDELWNNRQQLRQLINSGHLEKDDPILNEGKKALVTVDEMDNAIEALNSALENPTVAALSKAIANGQRLQNQYGKFCDEEIQTARTVLADQTSQGGRARQSSQVLAAQQVAHWKARRKANAERKKKRALTMQNNAVLTPTEHKQVEALDRIIAIAKKLKNRWGNGNVEKEEFGLCAIESISESIRGCLPSRGGDEDENESQVTLEKNEEWALGRMQASLEDADGWMMSK